MPTRMNFPERKAPRRKEAEARQAEYDNLSIEEKKQIEKLMKAQ